MSFKLWIYDFGYVNKYKNSSLARWKHTKRWRKWEREWIEQKKKEAKEWAGKKMPPPNENCSDIAYTQAIANGCCCCYFQLMCWFGLCLFAELFVWMRFKYSLLLTSHPKLMYASSMQMAFVFNRMGFFFLLNCASLSLHYPELIIILLNRKA